MSKFVIISGRELHRDMKIEIPYLDWFSKMCKYGFIEGRDYTSFKAEQVLIVNGHETRHTIIDHAITITMGKNCIYTKKLRNTSVKEKYYRIKLIFTTLYAAPITFTQLRLLLNCTVLSRLL